MSGVWSHMSNSVKRVCIIGGVAGGASAAVRLRRLDANCSIRLFERGGFVSYASCGLPYFIGDVIHDKKKLVLVTPDLFKKRWEVDVVLNHQVIKIKKEEKLLVVQDLVSGKMMEEPYDKLVLSPGAKPIRPPIPGIDHPSIQVLRTVPDSYLIRDLVDKQQVKKVVIVGGGFIGMELAENFAHRNIHVTIIEKSSQLMPALDFEMTTPLLHEAKNLGIDVILNDGVIRFDGELEKQQVTVATETGKSIEADLVLMSIGVAPENTLAKDAGIELGVRGAIRVDEFMKTSDPNIYAVGDVVESKDFVTGLPTNIPLAGPASLQARVAASNIVGKAEKFRGVQGTAICGFFGLALASTGPNTSTLLRNGYTRDNLAAVRLHPGNHVGYYPGASRLHLKVLYNPQNGKVLGAQAVGKDGESVARRIDVISTIIQMKGTVDDLAEAQLCYSPQYGAAKDPVNIAGFIAQNNIRGLSPSGYWTSIEEFKHSANDILLDVRTPPEFAKDGIKGALNIPIDELRARHKLELDQSKTYHLICLVGQRAYGGVRILRQLGYDAKLLSGGMITHHMIQGDQDFDYEVPL